MRYGVEDSDLTGAVLNQRWRVVRTLGSGGIGLVVEVAGLGGEGSFAAKLLRREFLEDRDIVARFIAEGGVAAHVAHPGIAQVYEAARAEDGTPYLVMELLRGEPLSAVMNQGRMPVARAVPLVRGLLEALGAAHAASIVHRDLKPDNLFLVRDGEGQERLKVLDFGIARVVETAGGISRRTRTGMLLGTPGYMSPEQLKNAKEADARSDLWAVGVLLYELLTGCPAFPGQSEFERMATILTAAPTPIDQVMPGYAYLVPFFTRALAQDPSYRFSSAADMAAALAAVARGDREQAPTQPHYAVDLGSQAPSTGHLGPRPAPSGPFGGTDTAVSAPDRSGTPNRNARPEPSVIVLPPRRRTVPLWVAGAMSLSSLALGLIVGYLLGVG